MSRFTYEIKTTGPKRTLIFYDDGRQIYASNPTFTATDEQLLQEAKSQLIPNYGNEIDQATQLPPSTLSSSTSPTAISSITTSSAPPTRQQLDKNAAAIKKSRDQQKEKFQEAKNKQKEQVKSLIKEIRSTSTRDAKNQAIALLKPALLAFIQSKFTIQLLIDTLIRVAKKKFEKKGILEINDLAFTFTPIDTKVNWMDYKRQFDSKLNTFKRIINDLKSILNTLRTVSRIINVTISLILVYIRIKQALNNRKLATITIELASPSQSKPTAGIELTNIILSIAKLEEAKLKVETWRETLVTVGLYIEIFIKSINDISRILNRLSLTIIMTSDPATISNKSQQINNSSPYSIASIPGDTSDTLSNSAPDNEEYLGPDGTSYIFVLKILPNGFRQYQALDSFSKFKIAQTAPSKAKSNQELFDEIKQIIG